MAAKPKYWTRWEKIKHRATHLWYAFTRNYANLRPKAGRVIALRCGWRSARMAWRSCNVWPGW